MACLEEPSWSWLRRGPGSFAVGASQNLFECPGGTSGFAASRGLRAAGRDFVVLWHRLRPVINSRVLKRAIMRRHHLNLRARVPSRVEQGFQFFC